MTPVLFERSDGYAFDTDLVTYRCKVRGRVSGAPLTPELVTSPIAEDVPRAVVDEVAVRSRPPHLGTSRPAGAGRSRRG